MKPYIFFLDGDLYACEVDEMPVSPTRGYWGPLFKRWKKNAIESGLPVSNPEIIKLGSLTTRSGNYKFMVLADSQIMYKDSELYRWPGTLTRDDVPGYANLYKLIPL